MAYRVKLYGTAGGEVIGIRQLRVAVPARKIGAVTGGVGRGRQSAAILDIDRIHSGAAVVGISGRSIAVQTGVGQRIRLQEHTAAFIDLAVPTGGIALYGVDIAVFHIPDDADVGRSSAAGRGKVDDVLISCLAQNHQLCSNIFVIDNKFVESPKMLPFIILPCKKRCG